MVLGVGSLGPNEKDDDDDDDDDEVEPTVTKDGAWMKLLDGEEGMLSLKPWKEVTALKATKVNLGNALREYMRQAWGKVPLFITIFPT